MKKLLLLSTVSILLFACKKNHTETKPPPPPQNFPEKFYGQWILRETGFESGAPNTSDTLAKQSLFFDAHIMQTMYQSSIVSRDSFSLFVTDTLHSTGSIVIKNGVSYSFTMPSQYQLKLSYTVGIGTTYRIYARWLAD